MGRAPDRGGARRNGVAHAESVRQPMSAISYQPIAGCFYNGDDPLQLMRQVPDLLAFHSSQAEAFAPLSDIDPYACNLRLQAISAGDRDEIARILAGAGSGANHRHSAGCACRGTAGC